MAEQPVTTDPTKAEARAEAIGEKARQKALRPWFKKKRFILPMALVAIFVIVQVANGGSGDTPAPAAQSDTSTDETSPTETESEPEEAAVPGIGATLTSDDGVSATLSSVEYAVAVPDDFIFEDPKGSLASAALNMNNASNDAVSLSSSSVVAFIGDAEYEATALLGPDGQWYLFEEINPGLGTAFTAYFDLPADTQIDRIEFRSSLFDFKPLTFTL